MHRSDDQKLLINLATDLLLGDDVRNLVREARTSFKRGVQAVRWEPPEAALQHLTTKFDAQVLPMVEKLRPNGKVSNRIRSYLGRMLFTRFLKNAACTSTPLRDLARRYACDLLTYGSQTFQLRTVVPLLAFEPECEFSLAGRIGREQYRCRISKLNGRYPEFFGYYMFPRPADYARPHPADAEEYADWAVIIDVVAPRDKDGDVGRGEPATWHVPLALVTALRLFADGDVRRGREYTTYGALHLSGLAIQGRHVPGGFAPLTLTKSTLREFRRWWRCLEPHVPFAKTLPPRLALAIDYFNSSYEKWGEPSFLDLHIALEALADVHTELTYRLPLRVSALLATTKSESLRLAEEVKSHWKIRCKIAHGDADIRKRESQDKMRAQLPQLRALVRQVIRAHFRLFEKSQRDTGAYEKVIKDFDETHILMRGYRH